MTKKHVLFAIIIGAAIVLSMVAFPKEAHEAALTPLVEAKEAEEVVEAPQPKPTVTPALVWWVHRLIMCESKGNVQALNPEDLDGTPSHGLLQFKTSTFAHFAKVYEIEGELMDPEAQIAILLRMVEDPHVDLTRQFPACIRMLGLPPQ